ncbi:CAP domain-containing protein [Salibacterium halotolerans]|uniref:Uncharacterized protein, YkwD family n=1 Tax=Salibacterium halotolerans TaxID=1884432 RepID=A0A1I5XEL0_9BACI|nr:CAP domain-containing protein [Salibacterium halotolerans]SFQ30344.1 uncharacterized protein, YkwD family [Salibacterium halotolerans]
MKKIIIASAVLLMFPAAAQAQNCITVEKGDISAKESGSLDISLKEFFEENAGQYTMEQPQQQQENAQQEEQKPEADQKENESDAAENRDAQKETTTDAPAAEAAPQENASEEQTAQQNTSDVESESEFEQQVIALTNEEREKAGLAPLKPYSELSDVARDKSKDMRDAGYFSHNSPNYGSPFDMMDSYGIDYQGAGENIAAGQRSPEQVVEGWMNSKGHRENILNEDFTHIGVGHAEGGSYGHYWTQMFVTK